MLGEKLGVGQKKGCVIRKSLFWVEKSIWFGALVGEESVYVQVRTMCWRNRRGRLYKEGKGHTLTLRKRREEKTGRRVPVVKKGGQPARG